jgi:hydrogenase maturation protease
MNMPAPRILIAGIGNIFLGDDAFGVEVAQALSARKLPEGVRLVDFGIRGLDLAYTLLEPWDAAILIDAVPRGDAPGTLYLIEPQIPEEDVQGDAICIEGHSMDPVKVLRMVRSLGGACNRLLVVGCEPEPFDAEQDIQTELSPAVRAAIAPAVEMVESLIAKLSNENPILEAHHAHENPKPPV